VKNDGMKLSAALFLVFFYLFLGQSRGADKSDPFALQWENLPELPQRVSGAFIGTVANTLIVAGGCDWPVSPYAGGKKIFFADVQILAPGGNRWEFSLALPQPVAYGGAVSLNDGLLIIGGCDAQNPSARAYELNFAAGAAKIIDYPDLPQGVAYCAAVRVGDWVYVAGGQSELAKAQALNHFYRLDLSEREKGWEILPAWPGCARILPVLATLGGEVYLFSGCELLAGQNGEIVRRYLTDAFSFNPQQGWQKRADLPHAVAAAPALQYGNSHILIFGGDDGENAGKIAQLQDNHPGFSAGILAYHNITDTWVKVGEWPGKTVTTAAVWFNGRGTIPGGEDRPGHRSAAVHAFTPKPQTNPFGTINFMVLAIYLLTLVAVGFYCSRREKTLDDFFLAGKRIPWWAAGLSIYGTQLSAITFMSTPAKTFATNWTYFGNSVGILLVAPVVVFFYLPFFRRLPIVTAYEYLEKRFSLPVRLCGSIFFILFQLGRMAIIIFLPAIALAAMTGIPIIGCILIMGIFCTIYTVLGGIEAVIWTDVLQVVVLTGGALLSLLLIVHSIQGGWSEIYQIARQDQKLQLFDWRWEYTVSSVWVVYLGGFFTNLIPYTSDQVVIQRYLTTADSKQAARSIWTNAGLAIPSAVLFFSLGTALYVFYKQNPASLNPTLQTDGIFPWFVTSELPAGISGLIVAGLFAAAMSSLDSGMNSVAAAIMTDWRRFKAEKSSAHSLRSARWLTLVIGAVATSAAILLASANIQSLWDLFIKLLGLLGGSLAGMFALGIFTRRCTGKGALTGAAASALLLFWVQFTTSVHLFLYGGIGLLSCMVVGYLTSLLESPPSLAQQRLSLLGNRSRE